MKNFQTHKKEDETEFDTIAKFDLLEKTKNSDSKVSSFLTIQEGCDKFCHFCVVPFTRGPECSRSFNTVLKEAEELIKNGAKEINNIGNSKIKNNTKDGTLSSSQKEFLSAISDVGIHAIKSNLKHVLMQNTINNKRKNKNVNNNIVKLNMNDNIDVNNNNSLVDDSDTESIASTTSTMTTMTDDTSISNDSGTTVSGFSSKNINKRKCKK